MAVTALLLVTAAILLSISLARLQESRELAFRASGILRHVAEVRADVRTAETGQRGYILTGEPRYLAPYNHAVDRVWATFVALRKLVRDPGQARRLAELEPLITAKLDELSETVALRKGSFEAALALVRTDVGQRLMEDIDTRVAEFERAEEAILVSGTGALERDATWATRLAGLTGLLAVGSAVLGALWFASQRAHSSMLTVERRFRRDLERQVEERTARLVELNRELDAFAYTISHDLRAPLRAMHGYADALIEDYGPLLPEDGRRFIRRIAAASERMEDLIQDILSYSRLAREEVSLRPVSLERIVDGVLTRSAERMGETGAEIVLERPLPAVLGHAPILSQAVENLVLNAVKFVGPGTRAQVRIRAEPRDGWVRLSVEDNGIGIAVEHHERIFRPFERLHGAEAYPGTGIGLAIVRRSVERMGGRCGVASVPGSGSTFWIELGVVAGGRAACSVTTR
ncbi:sensor histidine kinase [Salinarimonas soli]|nr:sensor histidine kinase [Salinarimonas soli]